MATDVVAAAPGGRGSPSQMATGAVTGAGNAMSFVVGFMPRKVVIINETQNIVLTKLHGSSPNTCVKEAAGAQTIDTTGLLTFPADTGLHEPGSTVLMAASMAAVGDKIAFVIEG